MASDKTTPASAPTIRLLLGCSAWTPAATIKLLSHSCWGVRPVLKHRPSDCFPTHVGVFGLYSSPDHQTVFHSCWGVRHVLQPRPSDCFPTHVGV
ncbi:hypothetical protein ElyMa_006266200 [Elysia marginata]|uniref:Secreted protein n=1 Tax=Elysia marginata TaxID=1093978 RepID=A0AAV4H9Y1_9GAST|nr:hypothetical protein ElyMa_006266200 [Elysia marginata]